MKKIFIPALLLFFIIKLPAQIPYYTSPGHYGQTSLAYQLADNVLYAATSRFTVTSTVNQAGASNLFNGSYDQEAIGVSAGQSVTITINFTGRGGAAIADPQGDIYIHFFADNTPDSIKVRFQDQGGTWYNISGIEDVTNEWPYSVARCTLSTSFSNAVKMEVWVKAEPTRAMKISEIDYILNKPGQMEWGMVTKFNSNTLWNNLSIKDTANTEKAFIKNNGFAFFGGKVGIGINPSSLTDTAGYKLFVNGSIRTHKLRVDQVSWSDYVFDKSYPLLTLSKVEQYIRKYKHLPGIPSAAVVKKEGIEVGNVQAMLLKKIEELTLYAIEQNKKIEQQQKILEQQQASIEQLKMQVLKKK